MDNKEYLSEEKYQKTNKGVNKAGIIMLVIGGIMVIISIILIISGFIGFGNSGSMNSFSSFAIGGFLLVFGFAIASVGGQLFFVIHRREITDYMTQQVMPVSQEGIDKMSPTVGNVAKEITKGIKAGLEDDKR